MKVSLSEGQILQLAANAVNAAVPVGMGFIHFEETNYTPDQLVDNLHNEGLNIDYFEGRMTKLYVHRDGDTWSFPDRDPTSDYQSWCTKYPTYQDLINSVL